jgi:hypothetical protein
MHERVRLAVIALNEAKAFHCVKEFDRAAGLLAGQLALRSAGAAWACARARAATALDRHRLAFDAKVGRRDPPAAINEREFERLTVGKIGQTGLLDRRNMDEHVLSAIVTNDEAKTLLRVEEFYDALAFANDLGRHSATSAAAAAKATATAAAAESTAAAAGAAAEAAAITKAAATAAAITAASTAAAAAVAAALLEAAKISAESWLVATETVALVATASAAVPLAPSIETHAPSELKRARLPLKPTRSGQMARPILARKTAHAPFVPLQEKCGRL